jgi:hypothetical protein
MIEVWFRVVGYRHDPDRKCNGVSAQRNGHLNASPRSRTRGSGSLPLTDATLMEEYCPIVPACHGVSIFSFRWDQLFEELKDHWDEKHYWMGILELEKLKDKKVMKNVWLLFCVVATFSLSAGTIRVIEDFEYASEGDLLLHYEPSTGAVSSLSTNVADGSGGETSMKIDLSFPSGAWVTQTVTGLLLDEVFSIEPEQYISFRLKGGPAFESADFRNIYLYVYDAAGNRMNYITDIAPVISSEWTTLTIAMEDFGDSSTIDTGNLVQWRILVEGWAEPNPALSGTFFVDDIRVSTQPELRPVLEATREGQQVRIRMSQLTPGSEYELAKSENLTDWAIVTTIAADADTADPLVDADLKMACYQLIEKP